MKTSELRSAALDWAVAKAIGEYRPVAVPNYSTNWSYAGPIIERESITLMSRPSMDGGSYWACISDTPEDEDTLGDFGPTPLIAAMRCYVFSKLGNEVEIPPDLV